MINTENFDVRNNTADNDGGGVVGGGMRLTNGSHLLVNGEALALIASCWHPDVSQCNRFVGNHASTENDNGFPHSGGALNLDDGSSMNISHVSFVGNRANGPESDLEGSAIGSAIRQTTGSVEISNSVFFNNGSGFDYYSLYFENVDLTLTHTSVVGELLFTVAQVGISNPGTLTIDNSIIVNPDGDDSPVLTNNVDKAAMIDINCILTNDSEGFDSIEALGEVSNVVVGDPAFVDRATGNLQLTTASAAIDMCPEVIGGHDLAFRERNHEVVVPLMAAAKGGGAEVSDMGAFEYIDLIFANGFELEGPPVR